MTKAQADKIKQLADDMVDVVAGGGSGKDYVAARRKLHETVDNFTYPEKDE